MTDVQHRAAAKEFAAHWKNRVDEKQETQRFWIDLLRNVYGVPNPEQYIEFEVPVKLSHTSFTDGYHYSKDVVYNNFLWPTPTDEQRARIGQTAQAILDARNLYPDCSLADLYDETTMPPELRKAHQQNDRAVMQAYTASRGN